MSAPRSLSSKLVGYSVLASMIAFFTLPATTTIPMTLFRVGEYAYVNLEGWTTKRPRALIQKSLTRMPSGGMAIKRNDALFAHEQLNPEFRFAVIDAASGEALPGSNAELVAAFAQLRDFDLVNSMFHLPGDPNPKSRGFIRLEDTPFGPMKFITYGSYFHWDDVLYAIYHNLTINSVIAFLPLGAAVAGMAYVIVRSGLAPLRSAAAKAASIDANSLSQRIPEDELPSEVLPFVQAMNGALERVDEGVARERRFTANAAHELRTPIAILRARVDKLEEAPLKHDIKRDVRRIQSIVEQLLVLAQIQRRGDAPERKLDLCETVLAIAADYMPIAIDNRRCVEYDAPPHPVLVCVDQWAVECIVSNLIENALRAEPESGAVMVSVKTGAVIEVIDHGDGIAAADRELIFEPFWRKDDSAPGTGLGLSIVRELVTKIGGAISIDTTPGGGATFAVRLKECGEHALASSHRDRLETG